MRRRVLIEVMEILTGDVNQGLSESRARATYCLRTLDLMLASFLSYGFAQKCSDTVRDLIDQNIDHEMVLYPLIEYTYIPAFAASILVNMFVNGRTVRFALVQSLVESPTSSFFVEIGINLLTLPIAFIPALIFLRPLLTDGTNLIIAYISAFARLNQMNHGLRSIASGLYTIYRHIFDQSGVRRFILGIALMIAVALTALVGFKNASFDVPSNCSSYNSTSVEGICASWVEELSLLVSNLNIGYKIAIKVLTSLTYCSTFSPHAFLGILLFGQEATAFISGRGLLHTVVTLNLLSAGTDFADMQAGGQNNGTLLPNTMMGPVEFASTFFINMHSFLLFLTAIVVALNRIQMLIKRCGSKHASTELEDPILTRNDNADECINVTPSLMHSKTLIITMLLLAPSPILALSIPMLGIFMQLMVQKCKPKKGYEPLDLTQSNIRFHHYDRMPIPPCKRLTEHDQRIPKSAQ